MQDVKIFSGSSHPRLAQEIAKNCGASLGKIQLETFSCGERYVRFKESFRGQSVFLVQTGRTDHMNDDLMELFFMINAAKQSFAKKIHIIMPYMPYSRQDKIHEPREGISAKLVADLLIAAGADHIITVHLHTDQIQGFFSVPADNLNPSRLLIEYFQKKNIADAVVVSPDVGGAKSAKKFADTLGVPLAILHKYRPEHNKSRVSHVIGDVVGKTPILIDDMIDGAGSACNAREALIAAGAREESFLCATHAVFSGEAREKLNAANFSEIICTDTLPIENPPKNLVTISMAPLLADVIDHVVKNQSVSTLY